MVGDSISAGYGALGTVADSDCFPTESHWDSYEAIAARKLARDWKLPKEVIGFIGQQASGAKDEVLRVFSDEVRRFLESEAVRREFWKALSAAAIEVKAEIRLVPTADGKPKPEVKATVRAKRGGARRKAKR